MGCREFWVPGICRVGPFSGVRSIIGKLMVTAGTGSSRVVTRPVGIVQLGPHVVGVQTLVLDGAGHGDVATATDQDVVR